ncbi:MAG: hypothetical protein GX652_04575 [Burkholderiaceae bacterium]|nr:hypothetical protein [Burkholderiaceae bacterium]
MSIRAIALAMLALALGGSGAAGAPRPFDDAPAGLREEAVLAGALVGRSRLHVSRFLDPRPPEAVLRAVAAAWSERPAPIRRETREGWLVLVQAVEDAVEVLEVRAVPRGGSEGRRSRWQGSHPGELPKADSATATQGAWLEGVLPAGSQVLQRITHRDAGRQTTTLVALTASGLSDAARHVASALELAGFSPPSRAIPGFRGQGEAFFLARRREEVAVTVSELEGHRAVVVHWGMPSP